MLLSGRLDKFVKKKADLYNFRCPYCGDSQKHRNKARGYFFRVKADMVYKCHNCGVGRTLPNFLKDQAPDLYDEYIMERYKKGTTGKGSYVPKPKFDKPVFKKTGNLESISDLNNEHTAVKYLRDRKIPEKFFGELFYTRRFYSWTNTQKPSFDIINKDQPRIIIPFIDEGKKGEWFGFQGRSLAVQPKMRYITILIDENQPKIYGLERVNRLRPVYVTEGPFDSTFLRNSIAMCGSDGDVGKWGISDPVWVYDNEPRNKEITTRISNTIDRGDKVVIWPNNIKEKDINDMVLAGHSVQELLESNIYNGLKAKLQFNTWKRI